MARMGLPQPGSLHAKGPTVAGKEDSPWPAREPHVVADGDRDSDHQAVADLLNAIPSLATAGVARRDEFLPAERLAQVCEGDNRLAC